MNDIFYNENQAAAQQMALSQGNVPDNQAIQPSLQEQINWLMRRVKALEDGQLRYYPPVRFPYEQAQGWQAQAQAQGDWSQYQSHQSFDNRDNNALLWIG